MAKEKRSVEDLDAELAALEAELAALESGTKPKKQMKLTSPPPAPEAKPPREPDASPAPVTAEKKSRFGIGRKSEPVTAPPPRTRAPEPEKTSRFAMPFGKKKVAAAPVAPQESAASTVGAATDEIVLEEAPAHGTPSIEPPPAPPIPVTDGSLWRREGDAWVRAVPRKGAVIRRVLDEDDNVLREESATHADLDDIEGVQAERGLSRMFGKRRSV